MKSRVIVFYQFYQIPFYQSIKIIRVPQPTEALKLSGKQVRQMSRQELQTLEPVQEALAEARQQLTASRQTLCEVYGHILRLRTYTVVAVGYDRLVWQQV